VVGAVFALVLISISPTIQEDVLGNATSLFPLKNPALVSMPLAFLTGIVVSLLSRERRAEELFYEAERQMHLGVPVPAPVVRRRTVLPARGK
jgi:cation/acetate symporter